MSRLSINSLCYSCSCSLFELLPLLTVASKKYFLRQNISYKTATIILCCCHNLQGQITLDPLERAAVSSLPSPLFRSFCNGGILKVSDPWSPPTGNSGSQSLCPDLTLSKMIHLGKEFLTDLSHNSCLLLCECLSGSSAVVLSKLAKISRVSAPLCSFSLDFVTGLWSSGPCSLRLCTGHHAGPRALGLCDRLADMLGGPHNSFCKQMGIYQVDNRLRSGLFNPIIGFRFKQVIKTAARAFFQQTRSSRSECSGQGQNLLLKGDCMNARNVPC